MSQTDESDYSSSEEDEDYVPSGEDESCDELEDTVVEEGTVSSPGQKKKTKTKKEISASDTGVRRRKGWNALADVAAEEQNEGGGTDDVEERLAEAREEEVKKKEEELKKKRADDLWSSFLSDVGQRPKPKPTPSQQQQNGQSIGKAKASTQSTSSAALSDKGLNGSKSSETVKITKVYDFAGEEVRVTKEVDAASKEAKSFLKKQEEKEEEEVPPASSGASTSVAASKPAAPSGLKRAGGGLGSVLGQIGKKQKISTLEKSRLDWMNFKKAEGIEEDLKIHNKGKDGYVERQKFLQRADVRQYEIERDIRLSQTKILR